MLMIPNITILEVKYIEMHLRYVMVSVHCIVNSNVEIHFE